MQLKFLVKLWNQQVQINTFQGPRISTSNKSIWFLFSKSASNNVCISLSMPLYRQFRNIEFWVCPQRQHEDRMLCIIPWYQHLSDCYWDIISNYQYPLTVSQEVLPTYCRRTKTLMNIHQKLGSTWLSYDYDVCPKLTI